jgi:uncharacterized membrane protein
MLPVAVNVPAVGSYSSALARAGDSDGSPPVMRALPSESNVAVWKNLVVVILPVAVNLPALGSYSSALAR